MERNLTRYCRILLGILIGIGLASACQKQADLKPSSTASISVSNQQTITSTSSADSASDKGDRVPTEGVLMEATGPIPTPAADVVRALLDQVDRERALSDLRKLSGEEPVCVADGCHTIQNRETGSQGLQWAKDYVYQELVALGYSVDIQDWSRGEYADQNLVVRKEGTVSPGEEIYFLAHLDGYKPDGVERSPAADDDATGVVALLELARVLSSHSVAKTVVLLISTGEEHGALGARSYIDQLSPDELAVIKYAVSVEMLGYDSNGDGAMQLWPGDHAPSEALAEELSGVIKTYELKLDPAIITGCD